MSNRELQETINTVIYEIYTAVTTYNYILQIALQKHLDVLLEEQRSRLKL